MTQLKVIERNGVRVLTTEQIADAFGADVVQIHKNFNYNKKRFEEGKHYLELRGEELKQFKASYEFSSKLKHSPVLYLWTDKGAFLHAKSLNTDQAWDAYNSLIDDYYKKVEEHRTAFNALSPQLQFMIMVEQKQKELEDKQKELEAENAELKQNFRHLELVVDNEVVLTKQQRAEIQQAVNRRQGELNIEGYTSAHFQGIYKALKTHFNVPTYSEIKRSDFESALKLISGWYPRKKEEAASH